MPVSTDIALLNQKSPLFKSINMYLSIRSAESVVYTLFCKMDGCVK